MAISTISLFHPRNNTISTLPPGHYFDRIYASMIPNIQKLSYDIKNGMVIHSPTFLQNLMHWKIYGFPVCHKSLLNELSVDLRNFTCERQPCQTLSKTTKKLIVLLYFDGLLHAFDNRHLTSMLSRNDLHKGIHWQADEFYAPAPAILLDWDDEEWSCTGYLHIAKLIGSRSCRWNMLVTILLLAKKCLPDIPKNVPKV